MASNFEECEPFRLLDLPSLRVHIYEFIDFFTTWHVLDRAQALIGKREWPVPPKGQVYDSRINLIRPHAPIELLLTCHLVYEEARPVIKRKTELCRAQPLRYLVDYSAAWALIGPTNPFRGCLGMQNGFTEASNETMKNFIQLCRIHLSRTRRIQNGSLGPRTVEMTITYKEGVVYGREVMETILWLGHPAYYTPPTRLVVVYKTPVPDIQINGMPPGGMENLEGDWLKHVPRENGIGDETGTRRGIVLRPLENEAFEKHVRELEWYKVDR